MQGHYASNYHGSNYHASNYYRPSLIDEPKNSGGGVDVWGEFEKQKRLKREDEEILMLIMAFMECID